MNETESAKNTLTLSRIGKMLWVAVKDFFHDSAPQWAAAVAYYSLLSTVPLLLAIAAIASFFVQPQALVNQVTGILGNYLPQGAGQLESLVTDALNRAGSIGLISTLTFLWTGSRVFGAVVKALNIAYDVDENYGFLKRTLVEVLMLLTIGLFFIAALASRYIINALWNNQQTLSTGRSLIVQGISALLLLIAFFLIYRFLPRRTISWQTALAGSAVATLLFIVARPLFITYVNQFASYRDIYGSLAIVVILVFWAWIVAAIMLFGGEIASHSEAMFIEGESGEEVEQKHLKRSPTKSVQS